MVFQNDRKLFEPRTLPRASGWRSWRYVMYIYIYIFICCVPMILRPATVSASPPPLHNRNSSNQAMAEANLLPGWNLLEKSCGSVSLFRPLNKTKTATHEKHIRKCTPCAISFSCRQLFKFVTIIVVLNQRPFFHDHP